MIRNSFIFLPGIGLKKEHSLWHQGVRTWSDFIQIKKIKGISSFSKKKYDSLLIQAREELYQENLSFWSKVMPFSEQWRFYAYFHDQSIFLDIEGSASGQGIKLVGLSDGYNIKTLVKGVNLNLSLLKEQLKHYKLLVTFNGASFDLPQLRKKFLFSPSLLHFDLRSACQKLGLTGSLKQIEKLVGWERESPVHQLYSPHQLWQLFWQLKSRHYLDLLVKYNQEDVLCLHPLADYLYQQLKKKYSFPYNS